MKLKVRFDPTIYGAVSAALLAPTSGSRRMPLTFEPGCLKEAATHLQQSRAELLFPGARCPRGALSGLWLYFSRFEESHRISQDLDTPEGSYWHGIAHRREPDPGNAAYWFRRVGRHPVFPSLREAAVEAGGLFKAWPAWDPFAFIDFCEEARTRPGSEEERIAMDIQLAEWQLLFDYCAGPIR